MERELLQYLKDAATLECQIVTQKRLIQTISWNAGGLGRRKSFNQPVMGKDKDSHVAAAVISWTLGVFLWFAVFFWYTKDLPKGALSHLPDGILYFVLLLPLWMGIPLFYVPYRCIINKKNKNYYQKEYDSEMRKYNAAVEADEQRVVRELAIKQKLTNQIAFVNSSKQETTNALQKLYSLNIVHPKYRNLVAITSFYDYFDTGRCTSLTGPGGAYDTYEYEKRFNIITTQLDVISQKLDEIINNQQYICDLMRESNATLSRIEQQNNQIMRMQSSVAENVELTAYNTQCTAQSVEIMEHMYLYSHLLQ